MSDDDLWTLHEWRRVRARKHHRCYECGAERIRAGDDYGLTRGVFDGRWAAWKECLRCERARVALRKAAGAEYQWLEPRLRDALREHNRAKRKQVNA